MRFGAMSISRNADGLESSFNLEIPVLRELYAYCW